MQIREKEFNVLWKKSIVAKGGLTSRNKIFMYKKRFITYPQIFALGFSINIQNKKRENHMYNCTMARLKKELYFCLCNNVVPFHGSMFKARRMRGTETIPEEFDLKDWIIKFVRKPQIVDCPKQSDFWNYLVEFECCLIHKTGGAFRG
jgi:hypothetical protein